MSGRPEVGPQDPGLSESLGLDRADRKERVCYVCGHRITSEALKVPGNHKQGTLYRHRVWCEPGAKRHMDNRKLRRAYLRLFRPAKGEEHDRRS